MIKEDETFVSLTFLLQMSLEKLHSLNNFKANNSFLHIYFFNKIVESIAL